MRELLQTGLRSTLMNLAHAKRLSVPGLEGLARLLELLTNYCKVEVGHRLLDHFRFVAGPQLLQESLKLSISDNEGIAKLVRLGEYIPFASLYGQHFFGSARQLHHPKGGPGVLFKGKPFFRTSGLISQSLSIRRHRFLSAPSFLRPPFTHFTEHFAGRIGNESAMGTGVKDTYLSCACVPVWGISSSQY
jgi:hypothetical protein